MIRKRKAPCLDSETLAALARGSLPVAEVEHVRQHLPQCSKCVGVLAAQVRRRANAGRLALVAESDAPADTESSHGRLFRTLAVAVSLLALGSSATCWYLDRNVPGRSRALDQAAPSDVARGAITGIE